MDTRQPLAIGLVVLGLYIGSVGAEEDQQMTPEQRLGQRARQYWEAIKLNDLATAYRIEAGSVKGTLTPHAFRESLSGSGRLVDFQIGEIRIEHEAGMVDVHEIYTWPPLTSPIAWDRHNPWVLIDGQWYHQSQSPSLVP